MQSNYHNVPLVNGVGQAPGRQFAARDVSAQITDGAASLELDLAGANPAEAGIRRWVRRAALDREARQIVLEDAYALEARPASLALHLMASGPVDVSTAGELRCAAPGRSLLVSYPPETFGARVEEIPIEDARLKPVWGERVYRVILDVRAPVQEGSWRLTMRAAS
jgi:hypothetical protein